MSGSATETQRRVNRRVRAVVRGGRFGGALVLFNNRVTPGHTTLMLPGGGIEEGETALQALQRELAEECGVVETLGPGNTRFLFARSYEFDAPAGGDPDLVELGFFDVWIPGVVPRNMEPDKVWAMDFVSLQDVERFVNDPAQNYRIQLGALDALYVVLDPGRSGAVEGGAGRETSPVRRMDRLPRTRELADGR